MTDPSRIINPPPQPLFSVRRLVIVVLLTLVTAALVVTCAGTDSPGGGIGCSHPAVAGFDPCPGARILRQATVGVELKAGYDGRIVVNGIAVPEREMVGAILPGTDAYAQLSAEERSRGPRPNNKNVVKFESGEGKVIEKFSGQVEVTVRYWQEVDGPDNAETLDTYTVFVT